MKTQKPLPNPPLQYEPEYMYDLSSLIISEEAITAKTSRDNVFDTGSIILRSVNGSFWKLAVTTKTYTETCSTTDDSTTLEDVVTDGETLGERNIRIGTLITGTGISSATNVVSITNTTSLVMSNAATITGTPSLTFTTGIIGTVGVPTVANRPVTSTNPYV